MNSKRMTCPRCHALLRPVPGSPARWLCPACKACYTRRGAPPPRETDPWRGAGRRAWLPLLLATPLALALAGAALVALIAYLRPHPQVVAAAPSEAEPPPPGHRIGDTVEIPPGTPPDPPPPQDKPHDPPPRGPVLPPPAGDRPQGPPAVPDPRHSDDPRINRAIDRGVAYLRARLGDSFRGGGGQGYQAGVVALAGLALLESGVPADDPALRRAADDVRAAAHRLSNPYEVSVAAWFLGRLGEKKDATLIRGFGLQLVAAQTRYGGWGYECPPLNPAAEERLLAALKAPPPAKPLPSTPPAVAYRPVQELLFPRDHALLEAGDRYDDNSNTQFAILALWAARKHGVPVERPLAMAERRFRTIQAADGSWGYRPNMDGSRVMEGMSSHREDSMTCAGLLGLAVGRAVGGEEGRTAPHPGEARDEAVSRALAYLGRTVGRSAPVTAAERARLERRAAGAKRRQEELLARVAQGAEQVEPAYGMVRSLERLTAGEKEPERAREQINAAAANYEPLLAKVEENSRRVKEIYLTGDDFHGGLVRARSWGDLYFLFSLERMAVVYGLTTVAGHDWYAWGSGVLVAAQGEDGSWSDAFPGVVDTCFALLFLRRANVVPDLTRQLQTLGRIRDVPAGAAEERSKP